MPLTKVLIEKEDDYAFYQSKMDNRRLRVALRFG
jgi:hypothetical protein